jgi:hypothetical protein
MAHQHPVLCVSLSTTRDAALQRAEGEKVTRVKAAEAEAEASYLQGLGISRQRQVRWKKTQLNRRVLFSMGVWAELVMCRVLMDGGMPDGIGCGLPV